MVLKKIPTGDQNIFTSLMKYIFVNDQEANKKNQGHHSLKMPTSINVLLPAG